MARKHPTNHQNRLVTTFPEFPHFYASAQRCRPMEAVRVRVLTPLAPRRAEETLPTQAGLRRRSLRGWRRAGQRRCGTWRSLRGRESTELDGSCHIAGVGDLQFVEHPVAQPHYHYNLTNGAIPAQLSQTSLSNDSFPQMIAFGI